MLPKEDGTMGGPDGILQNSGSRESVFKYCDIALKNLGID